MSGVVGSISDFASVAEVALLFGYSASHVRLLCDTGRVVAKKSCGVWIIYIPSVVAYVSH